MKEEGNKEKHRKTSVCVSDIKIQMTTKWNGGEKSGNSEREREEVHLAQNICRMEKIQQCAQQKHLHHKVNLSSLSEN